MADVARAAGVHVSTVSLGLRNSSLLPEATRKAVQEVAKRLNYRPHPDIATLMQRRRRGKKENSTSVVAFVTAHETRDGWRKFNTSFGTGLLEGARQRAADTGFRVDEFWVYEGGMNTRRFCSILEARNIHGILLAPLPLSNRTLNLNWEKFSVVAYGLTAAAPLHKVSNDHFGAMVMAYEQCRKLGYRRIGFATNAEVHQKVEMRWLAAYLASQGQHSTLERLPPLIAEEWSEAVVRSWLTAHRPDVIISNHPDPLQRWLASWGLVVPQDLGLVSLSGSCPSDPTSGICQRPEILGARGLDLLGRLISRNETGVPAVPETLLVKGEWNPGTTVDTTAGRREERCPEFVGVD